MFGASSEKLVQGHFFGNDFVATNGQPQHKTVTRFAGTVWASIFSKEKQMEASLNNRILTL